MSQQKLRNIGLLVAIALIPGVSLGIASPALASTPPTANVVPDAPAGLIVSGQPCVRGTARPLVGTAAVSGEVQEADPDVEELSATVRYGLVGSSTTVGSVTQEQVHNPDRFNIYLPGLTDGQNYWVQAQASDGQNTSAWSQQCEFTVDSIAPDQPPTISSSDYPDDGEEHGGIGHTGAFTITANGVTDVASYSYATDGLCYDYTGSVKPATLGGPATIRITPTTSGTQQLCVTSIDRVGHQSPLGRYTYSAGPMALTLAHYTADAGTGKVLADSGTGNHPATLAGNATWAAGRTMDPSDKAIKLNGKNAYAATGGPVFATDNTFVVAAWVKIPAMPTADQTVLSAAGAHGSSFSVHFSPDLQHWAFSITDTDSDTPTTVTSESYAPIVAGNWVYVGGIYDAAAGSAAVMLNGQFNGYVQVPSAWKATGRLLIGRSKVAGVPAQFFQGAIDDVRIWDRVVTTDQLQRVVEARSLEGHWALDEGSGASSADTSGRNHTLALSAGAAWTTGHDGTGSSLLLNGTNGYAHTTETVLRTDESFSVGAWVRLDDLSKDQTVLTQEGSQTSSFAMRYNAASTSWEVTVTSADSTSAPSTTVQSSLPASQGQWTHIAAVYSAYSGELSIYVNGQQQSFTYLPNTWNAAGHLLVGRSKAGDYFHGAIDSVYAYDGALSPSQISDLANE
jgi:hypothetical protein